MASLSAEINEITNHFGNLISRVENDIEQCMENYKEYQVLGELNHFPFFRRIPLVYLHGVWGFIIRFFESSEKNKLETVKEWSESTKVIDYLTQVRQRTIDDLKRAKEDSLVHLKSISCDLNHINESKDVEEMRSRLFADKFYFQVQLKPRKGKYQESLVFILFTIVVDFYLSQSDINFIEYLINFEEYNTEKPYSDSILNFDEKFILIQSIAQEVLYILANQRYPSHVMSFRKQDLLNIKSIESRSITDNLGQVNLNCSSNYLSNIECLDLHSINDYLKRATIDGFSFLKSLSLRLVSIEGCSFTNLVSLRNVVLDVESEINNDMLTKLFEICPNIEELYLTGDFSNISFDRFINLKRLKLCGNLLDGFNFDVFKTICFQLEELSIKFENIDDESITKLLCGHNFPNLLSLKVSYSKLTRLENKLLDGFPMLQRLKVSHNQELKTIDLNAFSNLKNFKYLHLKKNQLSELDPELFSGLDNFEMLYLASGEKYSNFENFSYPVKITYKGKYTINY